MNEFEKKFDVIREERLSQEERSLGRERIVSFMEDYRPKHVPSMLSRYPKRTTAALIASGLFALTTGISYAAEGALPGDTLYPVKVNVNEKVAAAFAVTPEAKANFERSEVERRASEAEALAKKNDLSDAKKEELATRSTIHIDSFIKANAELEAKGDEKNAKRSEEEMKRTIEKHRATFSVLGVKAAVEVGDDKKEIGATSTAADDHDKMQVSGHESNRGHGKDESMATSSPKNDNEDPSKDEKFDTEDETETAASTSLPELKPSRIQIPHEDNDDEGKGDLRIEL